MNLLENCEIKYLDRDNKIPKLIWMLWLQGEENAPYLVKKCIESWRNNNPDFTIIVLNKETVNNYINLHDIVCENTKYIAPALLSDIIRINLLNKYGGFWIDSTCFCCTPLTNWIQNYIDTGFFVFQPPSKSCLISSWFIGSGKDSYLTKTLCQEINYYCKNNNFRNQNTSFGKTWLYFINNVMVRIAYKGLLFKALLCLTKLLRVYPYFIFHYTFGLLTLNDNKFKRDFEHIKYYSSDIPHRIQHYGMLAETKENIENEIDKKSSPLYKLTYRYDIDNFNNNCVLYYLFEKAFKSEK